MNSGKNSLISLIAALSRGERKHIMTNTLKKGTVLYDLFRFISEKKPASDEDIKKHFAGSVFLRQLHVTKINLTEAILEGMSSYHLRDSVDNLIYKELGKAEFLFSKELFTEAAIVIEKVHKKALLYHKAHVLPEVMKWKKKLFSAAGSLQERRPESAILASAAASYIESLLYENTLWAEAVEAQSFFNEEKSVIKAKVEMINKEKRGRSNGRLPVLILENHLLFTFHTMSGDLDKAEAHCREIIRALEQNPHVVRDDPKPYFTACYNLIGLYIGRRDYAKVSATLERVHKAPDIFFIDMEKSITVNSKARAFNIEIEISRDLRKYRHAQSLMEEVIRFLGDYGAKIHGSYKSNIYFQFAHISFALGKYDESMSWLNELFRTEGKQVRFDILRFGKLLYIFVHYELGNFEHLIYAVDNYKKFLKGKTSAYEFEKTLLAGFLKLAKAGEAGRRRIMAEISGKLESRPEDREIYKGYFDVEEWLKKYL